MAAKVAKPAAMPVAKTTSNPATKGTLTGALAQATAPFGAALIAPLGHALVQHLAGGAMGSSMQDDSMDVDPPETGINHYNPQSLTDNCAFVSMAYLLDPTGRTVTAHSLETITGEKQPENGSGGVQLDTVKNMLDAVKAQLVTKKLKASNEELDYKLKPWSGAISPLGWCGDFKTKRFAIGFRRHDPNIPCVRKSRDTGAQKHDTQCTVVADAIAQGRQAGISGHFVVYDGNPENGKLPGFFDFQSGTQESYLKEGTGKAEQWLEEHGTVAFAFVKDPKAMDQRS